MKYFFFTFVAITTGCVSMSTQVKMMEAAGAIEIEEVLGRDFQFYANVKNRRDFGWNGNNPEDRRLAVVEKLKDKCPKPQILDERAVQTGMYAFGQPALVFVMKVKCD